MLFLIRWHKLPDENGSSCVHLVSFHSLNHKKDGLQAPINISRQQFHTFLINKALGCLDAGKTGMPRTVMVYVIY